MADAAVVSVSFRAVSVFFGLPLTAGFFTTALLIEILPSCILSPTTVVCSAVTDFASSKLLLAPVEAFFADVVAVS